MQAAEFADDLVARTQIEMVSVGEKDLNAQLLELSLRHPLDGAGRPNGHEDWRLYDPVRRMEKARTRAGCGVLSNNLKSQWHDG